MGQSLPRAWERYQALWSMILSASQKKKARRKQGGFRAPPTGTQGYVCGGEGGNKIIHKVLSIELLDFAATLWTYLRRTGLWLL